MTNSFKLIMALLFKLMLLQACLPIGWINKDYWTCNSNDSSVYFSNSRYFERVERGNKFFINGMIFYNDGFCALHHKKEFWNQMSHRQFGARSNVSWGRYKLLKDSIVIQFFDDTGCGGGSPFIYTVHQLAGMTLKDGSIIISSSEFNNACANSSYKQGYVLMPIDVQIFTTKEVSFPNDNSNWLMRKNIE